MDALHRHPRQLGRCSRGRESTAAPTNARNCLPVDREIPRAPQRAERLEHASCASPPRSRTVSKMSAWTALRETCSWWQPQPPALAIDDKRFGRNSASGLCHNLAATWPRRRPPMPIPKQPFEPDRRGAAARRPRARLLPAGGRQHAEPAARRLRRRGREGRIAGHGRHAARLARGRRERALEGVRAEQEEHHARSEGRRRRPASSSISPRTSTCMIESFRFRYLEQLGVGPDALLARNPEAGRRAGLGIRARPARTPSARASAPSSRPCRASRRATASRIASRCYPRSPWPT